LSRAIIQRQRQLDAARATADDRQLKAFVTGEQSLLEPGPGLDKAIDRLDRELDLVGFPYHWARRPRTDVDRQQVVIERRPVFELDLPDIGIERDHLVMNNARTGKARQRQQIDMGVIVGVMSGDETWQHA
jgi:hypothetical protein